MKDVDVHWETFSDGGRRYLRAGDWSLDPEEGDSPEYLEKSAEAFLAAAKFLRRDRQLKALSKQMRASYDREAGYRHATGKSRRPIPASNHETGLVVDINMT